MRMNESLELDVHRTGIRQSPVFTRISPKTGCDFPELKYDNFRTEDDKTIIVLILLKHLLKYSLRIFTLLSSPKLKFFKMTNNKSRTQNANMMTYRYNDPHFGEPCTNQKRTMT